MANKSKKFFLGKKISFKIYFQIGDENLFERKVNFDEEILYVGR